MIDKGVLRLRLSELTVEDLQHVTHEILDPYLSAGELGATEVLIDINDNLESIASSLKLIVMELRAR